MLTASRGVAKPLFPLADREQANVPTLNVKSEKVTKEFPASSLIHRLNTLFRRAGNLPINSNQFSSLQGVERVKSDLIREYSLYFPCRTGKSAETGSHETPCTTIPPPKLPMPG